MPITSFKKPDWRYTLAPFIAGLDEAFKALRRLPPSFDASLQAFHEHKACALTGYIHATSASPRRGWLTGSFIIHGPSTRTALKPAGAHASDISAASGAIFSIRPRRRRLR